MAGAFFAFGLDLRAYEVKRMPTYCASAGMSRMLYMESSGSTELRKWKDLQTTVN